MPRRIWREAGEKTRGAGPTRRRRLVLVGGYSRLGAGHASTDMADAGAKVADRGPEMRALVERAQAGDRGALEELYLLHFDRIYSYLHVSVGNKHDAEDLTTQT